MKPLVSILVPAFNVQEWIAETICSALAQSWQPAEIIVVDDGSTDQTLAIAAKFESDRVRVVTQPNQGAAAARNKALALSRGDYIQWLDADDVLAPDKVAKQIEAASQMKSRRTLLSGAWARFLYRWYRAQFVPTPLWCDLTPAEWLTRKMARNLHMQTATWLVSRELTEAAGPWDTSLLSDDDGEYFCRALLASDGVRFVPGAKVYYRITPNSLSHVGVSDRKINALWRSMELHIGYLRSVDNTDTARRACVTYLQNWVRYLGPERPDLVARAERLAQELGGQITMPQLSWKYAWIDSWFGASAAKRVQGAMRQTKWTVARSLDRALYHIESRTGACRTLPSCPPRMETR